MPTSRCCGPVARRAVGRLPPPAPEACYKCYVPPVERITHRELRNNSADVLRRVAAGESFEVTNHGSVVAVLGPPRHESVLDRLIAEGRAVPARRSLSNALEKITRVKLDVTTQEIIDDLRGP